MTQRLQKYMAAAGVASRRGAEKFIEQGRVTVNGRVASLGDTVSPGDVVLLDNKPVDLEDKVYYMLNKPAGSTTTVSDPHADITVMALMSDVPGRVFPVGRLDKDTEGLLLFTNDGDMAHRLLHPSHHVAKTYLVRVLGRLREEDAARLESGLELFDGKTAPAKVAHVRYGGNETQFELTIWEGRKRQVRRMCEQLDRRVIYLKRIRVGSLELGALPSGRYRRMDRSEMEALIRDGEKHHA